jgi:hypothetical protein
MNKYLITLSILIIVVILAGISVVFLYNIPTQYNTLNIQTNNPEALLDEVNTFDEQTYKNEKFEFEFKYPKDWKAITREEYPPYVQVVPNDISHSDNIFPLNIYPEGSGTISVFDAENLKNYDIKELSIDGRLAWEIGTPKDSEVNYLSRYITIEDLNDTKWDELNEISYSFRGKVRYEDLYNEYAPIYDRIIESIIFNADIIDTSDWQTYRNDEYGFEFKYPAGWSIVDTDGLKIKLIPPGKSLGYEYNGDIVITVEEPNGLDIKSYYNGKDRNNLFTEAEGGIEEFFVAGKKATRFSNICCMFPDNQIVIIEFDDKFLGLGAIDSFGTFNNLIKTINFSL